MIHTILLDLDNTLLDFSKAERIALSNTLKQLGIEPDEHILSRYSELNLAQWKLLEQGKISRNEVKLRRYRLLFDEYKIDCSAEEAARIYENMLGMGHYFIDGAEKLLKELQEQYSLYIVTNGTKSVQTGRIKSAALEKYFQGIFISEDIGFNKPSREFFERCFSGIPDFEKESTVIVGDSLTSDILGGINAGIKTIWFNPEHKINNSDILPDYEIALLNELIPLLDALK
ncbi:YjjG family noncanonical pyrimidine nucleotidase [Novisyntrophococcus fermenticellae]|uniref:YjjG family noncanonical pyrimidine nucleotidase n=1 Tax=Novisyntrophococcus fermenticellae TaxID=2068655 RepID=UPI001E39370C|nr:YjjG family noncanonical pyrimidine nucleotidase [Novisyntrophococcus fermenticellae]